MESTSGQAGAATGVPLRPMSVGDLFDWTFRLYRQHFGTLVVLGLIAVVPAAIIGIVVPINTNAWMAAPEGPPMEALISFGVAMMVFGIVAGIVGVVVLGAAIHVVSEAILGRRVSVGDALRVGLGRFWPIIGAGIIFGIVVVLLLFTIVGWIYFAVAWAFCWQAIVIERTGPMRGLGRSRELVRGLWWRSFGIGLLWLILISVLTGAVTFPLQAIIGVGSLASGPDTPLVLTVVGAIVNAIAQAIVTPLGYIGSTLYYYDLRVRKEGLDLQMRAGGPQGSPAIEPTT